MHPTRIFKSPEELEKAWNEYKEYTKKQAKLWPKVQYVGKDGMRVEDYPMMPISTDGFEIYCYNNYGCVNQYFQNKLNYYDEFVTICSRIKTEIRDQHITGSMLGFFNPSITQRLHGLKESTEAIVTNKIQVLNLDPLDDTTDNITKEDSRTKEED